MKRDQSTTILSILIFSIAIMLSGNVFAAKPVTPPPEDMATQAELDAAIANLQAQIDKLTPPVRAIGDVLPDNSIVFWIDETGQHGLAFQPFDDGLFNWYAAKEVAENHGPGWHLPTKHELNLLYLQKDVVGGFSGDYYWSSTEYDATIAQGRYFDNGSQGGRYKIDPIGSARAVRAF